MDWAPISEEQLLDLINDGWDSMTPPERYLWEAVQIQPSKWQCLPWGKSSGGFWAVGLLGEQVIWYNDLEYGFNCSKYKEFGVFHDYWCNQDGLNDIIKVLKYNLDNGWSDLCQAGPPTAGEFVPST